MFSAYSSLGITLLVQKYYFISVKLCYLWCFSLIQLKMLTFLKRGCLKIQFKVGSFLRYLFCVDTTLFILKLRCLFMLESYIGQCKMT